MESDSGLYSFLLFPKRKGYPLFHPQPSDDLPEETKEEGVRIGDVGVVTARGSFDPIFNILHEAGDRVINRFGVPGHFVKLDLGDHAIERYEFLHAPGSDISNTTINKKRVDVEASIDGNVFLPVGAGAEVEVSTYSKRTAVLVTRWSLDLGFEKSAIIQRLRRETYAKLTDGGSRSLSESVDLEEDVDSLDLAVTGYHPSHVIYEYLLECAPEATVAITHDNEWVSVLTEEDHGMPTRNELIRRISSKFDIATTESGAVFLRENNSTESLPDLQSPSEQENTVNDHLTDLNHIPSSVDSNPPGQDHHSENSASLQEDDNDSQRSQKSNTDSQSAILIATHHPHSRPSLLSLVSSQVNMPCAALKSYTSTYHSASSLPVEVWDALISNPQNSNCILPIALKSLAQERNHETALGRDQCWIVGHTPCLFSQRTPTHRLTSDFLLPRLVCLAEALRTAVPVKRVYSIFAPDAITTMFVEIWCLLTGVQGYKDPYYHATLSYCTKRSFRNRQMITLPGLVYELRPAVDSDLEAVASLCYQFAADLEPFVLSHEAAIKEAAILIRNNQIWVHSIRLADDVHDSDIASIVAFTRNTENVATISKVFTNPTWRRRGCAERLVYRVCKHLLAMKQSVALYLPHNDPGTTHICKRVGFLGLADGDAPVEGVDSWLEIGLDRSKVELGHW
ncbi:N-acetyltransferase domain-containing protein [Mycena venus]|uniref:N-acetyltransferase domain-containing protein n=1 Tax=Mycena venus TaxID=2733690 RepID=A0A8H7DH47_9AGAR|nr:N-acetyltransferase domain-containing protein [Mycena venus]